MNSSELTLKIPFYQRPLVHKDEIVVSYGITNNAQKSYWLALFYDYKM